MNLADRLRDRGVGTPNFTKDELVKHLEKKLTNGGYTTFIIGKHVGTDFDGAIPTIGDCNPYNRQYLYKWLNEEGMRYESGYNCYGVEHIKIFI